MCLWTPLGGLPHHSPFRSHAHVLKQCGAYVGAPESPSSFLPVHIHTCTNTNLPQPLHPPFLPPTHPPTPTPTPTSTSPHAHTPTPPHTYIHRPGSFRVTGWPAGCRWPWPCRPTGVFPPGSIQGFESRVLVEPHSNRQEQQAHKHTMKRPLRDVW